ncbi:MAG TPA: hypothetical protein VGJ90_11560 [Methylophilaceae bacterium]|jgi:hypothetical protein
MSLARFLSTDGPYLEAKIEVGGTTLCIMDEFSDDKRNIPKVGAEFEFEFSAYIDEGETWEFIFSGNPDKKIGIEQLIGWKYRAYGKIVSINPVVVDCGLLKVEGVIHTNDPRVIGEFVAFTISRLGGVAYT